MEVQKSERLEVFGKKNCITYDFQKCLQKACENNKSVSKTKTLTSAAISNDSSKLSINADRIKFCEWQIIFSVLQIENTLKKINIFSKRNNREWPNSVEEDANSSLIASSIQGPPIFTRYILETLIRYLTKSLARENSACEELFLQLPLASRYCRLLSNGLRNASKLQHISLAGCCIGDEECHHLCESLKNMKHVRILDLSDCKLGLPAVESLAIVIHTHGLIRNSLAWENSFRYRNPSNKNITIGLIRITLNKNPGIGDKGAQIFANVLSEDSWIKAIDLQMCNISNEGAIHLLKMLPSNVTISIIDIRGNQKICKYLQSSLDKALQSEPRSKDFECLPFNPPPKLKIQ